MSKISNEDVRLAQKVRDLYGIPVSITLGQFSLESHYGEKTSGINNYFGVRDKNGYKNYTSKEQSFLDYGKVISASRYDARKDATTTREYLQAIKDGGYASDPHYVSKVMSIIKKRNYSQYDDGDIKLGDVDSNTFGMSNGTYTLNSPSVAQKIVRVVFIVLLIGGGVALLVASVGGALPSPAIKVGDTN